jgi:hypothetical protein
VRQNLQNGVGYEAMQGVYRCHMNKAEQLQCFDLNKQERLLVVELLVVTILLEFSQKSDQFYLVPSQNRLDLWRFVRIRYEDLSVIPFVCQFLSNEMERRNDSL